jgi:hypothetical protein
MGLSENPTRHGENQAAGRRKHAARRPRQRPCLLKGCEQPFHPRQARQRYCSEGCRAEARKWSRWKAQQKYRRTAGGKQKRNGQSRRYRERVRSRKAAQPEAGSEGARVIPPEHFFRAHVRPAGVLRAIHTPAATQPARLAAWMILLALHARQITPTAWMMPLHLIPIPSPVLGVGHFSLALLDNSCQVPTPRCVIDHGMRHGMHL